MHIIFPIQLLRIAPMLTILPSPVSIQPYDCTRVYVKVRANMRALHIVPQGHVGGSLAFQVRSPGLTAAVQALVGEALPALVGSLLFEK